MQEEGFEPSKALSHYTLNVVHLAALASLHTVKQLQNAYKFSYYYINMASQDPKLEQMLGAVKNAADSDNLGAALILLTSAKEYAARSRLTIPTALEGVERKIYEWGTKTAMQFAVDETQAGRYSSAQMHLYFAMHYANLLGEDIMSFVREIRESIRKTDKNTYKFNMLGFDKIGLQ